LSRADGSRVRVELARGRTVYARGLVVDRRLVVQARRQLTAGHYTLVLRSGSGARGKVQRVSVTIT
jgi:hypothetical protein